MSESGPPGIPKLHIDLLGGCSAGLEGNGAGVLPTRKSQALLAYLAVPAGRFHARDKLTAMFWGETPEAQARQSFRQALLSIRRAFGGEQRPILLTRSGAIALDAEAVTVDVSQLEAALADGTTEGLERGAALYKGEFLAGLNLNEQAFEEWRAVERERLNILAVEALTSLVDRQAPENPEAAIQTVRRLLATDPSHERMHRTLMKLLLRQGQRAAALKQYQLCVGWLERELGVEPEEETRQLYRDILRSAGPGTNRLHAASSALRRQVNTRAEEAPMVGRDLELGDLSKALTQMLDAGGRIVLVRGEAGIGKSRLLREFIGQAVPSGVRILAGRCHETEQILPLHTWIDALRGDNTVLDPSVRCFYLGNYSQGQVAGERALSEGERAGNLDAIGKALHVLSLIAYETGHPQDGIAYANRAISVLEMTLEPQWLGLAYHDLALNSVVAGKLGDALAVARQEEAVGRRIGWPRLLALAGSVIAWALALLGEYELAVEAAQRSLELSRDSMMTNLISGSMGLAYLEQGDAQTAVKILSEVVIQLRKSPVRSGEARCLSFLSEAQLVAGDRDVARETALRALEVSQSDGFTFSTGLALRALGRIALAQRSFGEAERRLSGALATFTECGAALEAARTQASLAELFACKLEKKAARHHLAEALMGFRRAQAPKRVAEARRIARAFKKSEAIPKQSG